MDPVIAILQHAADTIGNAALVEVTKRAVGEAWLATVGVIKRRFGPDHPAPALVESLRDAAGDKARTEAIVDKLEPLRLGEDPDVKAAIERLSAAIEQQARSTVQGVGSVTVGTLNGIASVIGNPTMTFHSSKGD